MELVLSLFPGIGMLDSGFESEGFCVVRGPDLIWGGDVCNFRAPMGRFDGVIGGPPCQDFSRLRRGPVTGDGVKMLKEFVRIVTEARPSWWLMENVPGVPDVSVPGYSQFRLDVAASSFGLPQRRLRNIQFGSITGEVLCLVRYAAASKILHRCVTASDHDQTLSSMRTGQGLPDDFDIPAFTRGSLKRAIGNGVPLPMARALALAVKNRVPADNVSLCACNCARQVTGRQTYATGACRKRAFDQRAGKREVLSLGP